MRRRSCARHGNSLCVRDLAGCRGARLLLHLRLFEHRHANARMPTQRCSSLLADLWRLRALSQILHTASSALSAVSVECACRVGGGSPGRPGPGQGAPSPKQDAMLLAAFSARRVSTTRASACMPCTWLSRVRTFTRPAFFSSSPTTCRRGGQSRLRLRGDSTSSPGSLPSPGRH